MESGRPITELLACPRCGESLADSGNRCDDCALEFPELGGVRCLFADPETTLGEWRSRLHFVIRKLEREAAQLDADMTSTEMMALTRKRLGHLKAANEDHARRLHALLAPLDLESLQAEYETYLALRTRLPSDQGLTTYYNNIHRDWAWGDEENSASVELVLRALGDEGLGAKTLVLGAGAGRLAYDLHQATDTALTVAVDFNPLLALLAHRVMSGDSVELYEFPIAPRTLEDYAALRTLQAPEPAREGMHFILADALRAPFRDASFDTVITPWLVDILPEDFSVLCRRVNRLLAPRGRWIIFGSLAFNHANPALCYSLEECADAIRGAGFAEPTVHEATIPYMCSPASRHGRRESVVTWTARKEQEVESPSPYQALPDWLLRGDEPVPLLNSFQAQAISTRTYAFIMSLIDGRRSASDIAEVMSQQGLMTKEEAVPTIRTFLIKMYEDSQRQSGY